MTRLVKYLAVPFVALTLAAQSRWGDKAFTGNPVEVQQTAALAKAPQGSPAIVLLSERQCSYDDAGARACTMRTVYRVLNEDGVKTWGQVGAEWSPWHEQQPVLRARVIAPDGAVKWLDPKTLQPAGPGQSSQLIYSDRKVTRAPLPAIQAGAVVEVEEVRRETAPVFDGGVVERFYIGDDVPVEQTRLVVDAPAKLQLRHKVVLLEGMQVKREETGGRVRLAFEMAAMPPLSLPEPLMPGEIPRQPYVVLTTGRTWSDVAARYSEVVNEQLAKSANLGAIAAKVVQGKKERAEIANALLEWMRREVRYTGVEFGEAAIRPYTPDETLGRKYGDCKDQATLLAGLLRAAGLEADVALVRVSPDEVNGDLAGLGEFNHAIVRLSGTPVLWIDPTVPYTRAGELPSWLQGRMALIASVKTEGLVRMPETASRENRVAREIEIRLAKLGPASATETTTYSGSFGRDLRESLTDAQSDDEKKRASEYAKKRLAAQDLIAMEHSAVEDLTQPFQLRVKVGRVMTAQTATAQAEVAIPCWRAAEYLPPAILGGEEDDAAKETKRQKDLLLPAAFSSEYRWRLIPPAGFKPQALPENRKVALGPAELERELTASPDGVVTVTARFDSKKRRYTAEEVRTLRTGLAKLSDEETLKIVYEQTGESLLEARKVKEAIGEFDALAKASPTEALPRTRMARAYLAAGLGEMARAEAKEGVRLEPTSAAAYGSLGWVLQHDLVGRQLRNGMDRAGALAAYRRAKELDPSDATVRGQMAVLLEHDQKGHRYAKNADLEGAIAEYRAIEGSLNDIGLDSNLMYALAWAHKWKELRVLAEKVGNREFTIAAIAASSNGAAAIKYASTSIPNIETRRQAELQAGRILLAQRLYAPAADLMAEGARGSPQGAQQVAAAEMLRKTQRHEELQLDDQDPRTPLVRLLLALYSEDGEEEVKGLFTEDAWPRTKKVLGEMSGGVRTVRGVIEAAGIPAVALSDMVVQGAQMQVDGDQPPQRVRAAMLGGVQISAYVVDEGGRKRMVGMNLELGPAGAYVLKRLAAGDSKSASQLLNWLKEDLPAPEKFAEDASAASSRLLARAQNDPDKMRYAAAAVAAQADPTTAIPILEEGRKRASEDADQRAFDMVLAYAYIAGERWVELDSLSARLLKENPNSEMAVGLKAAALRGQKKWKEMAELGALLDKQQPGSPAGLRLMIRSAEGAGDADKATAYSRRLVGTGKATAGDLNNMAWFALFANSPLDQAVTTAERSVTVAGGRDAAAMHTLAVLYAESGRTGDARETILRSMDLEGLDDPDAKSWYVFGRIAEQLGFPDAARKAYKKFDGETGDTSPTSTYQLAQRRLKLMAEANKR